MYSQPDFYGSKYTGYQPAAQVSKQIRQDLKAAQAAGEIPADLTFSVKSDSYSMGQSVNVKIQGRTEAQVWKTETVNEHGFDREVRRFHPEAEAVLDKVRAIANAYNRDRSDSMVDYFDVMYYLHVDYESAWSRNHRAAQAAARAAKRAAKAA